MVERLTCQRVGQGEESINQLPLAFGGLGAQLLSVSLSLVQHDLRLLLESLKLRLQVYGSTHDIVLLGYCLGGGLCNRHFIDIQRFGLHTRKEINIAEPKSYLRLGSASALFLLFPAGVGHVHAQLA
jgi:hypothetical protein